MIELINEDYADFVSLSANFVNLDKSINQIKDPLVDLKEEITSIQSSLQDCMNEINECLSEKRRYRQIKKSLEALEIVRSTLEKLEKLLKYFDAEESKSRVVLLERSALELIQLQFNAKYCQHLLDVSEKSLIDQQEQKLLGILNDFFIATLAVSDPVSDDLEKCLRIYYSLDQCKLAENVFRKEVFNYMERIISDRNLHNFPDGLTGVYNEILNFVSLKMKSLLNLTRGKSTKIKGYNFLFNSFWSAIEERIELNLSSIFSPAIPEDFYQRYKCTLEFLTRIEMIIDDPILIQQFYQNEQYIKFQKKWNLPVYYLIRSQEIAMLLEKKCEIDESCLSIAASDPNQIQIKVFLEVINCIAKCWSDGIYLDQLFQNFLKLTFHMIARSGRWTKDVIKMVSSSEQDLFVYFTVLHHDIEIFIRKFPQIEQLIAQKLTENVKLKDKISASKITKCFDSPRATFERCQKDIEGQIAKKMVLSCVKSIKNVQDIPRLFRKTNREVPTKQLPYVDNILMVIDDFDQKHKKDFEAGVFQRLLENVFSHATIQYYQLVNEVLTSVQKTEESIRRLKNLREKSQQIPSSSQKQHITDDDKIRLQLQIDVRHYVTSIENYQLKREKIESLVELVNLTNDISRMRK
jgi:hypothetical protein